MMPLYEAKMFHQFDHRWATYDGLDVRDATLAEKRNTAFTVLPRYWVTETEINARLSENWDKSWLLAFRDIARSTDERTMISSALPRVGVNHKAPLVKSSRPLALQALFGSFVLDYVARQKIGGTSMSYFLVKQLPALEYDLLEKPATWDAFQSLGGWIEDRALRLIATADDIATALGVEANVWNESGRLAIRAELDAAFLVLFGATRSEAEHILDSFPIIRRKEWIEHGRYVTKERVLEAFDALTASITAGLPYISTLSTSQGAPA